LRKRNVVTLNNSSRRQTVSNLKITVQF